MKREKAIEVLNRALYIAQEEVEQRGICYKQCILLGIDRACIEFNISIEVFVGSFK